MRHPAMVKRDRMTLAQANACVYRVVIASEARQSSGKAARRATLDSAQLAIPTGLQQSLAPRNDEALK